MKYDIIISAGCSYTVGANIYDENSNSTEFKYTFTTILGRRFNLPVVHLGKVGGSNEQIIRTVYEWIKANTEFSNPLFLIGVTGITRFEFWSHTFNEYYDMHLFDFHQDKNSELYQKQINSRLPKVLHKEADKTAFENWIEVSQYMFNSDNRIKEIGRMMALLNSFIESHNGTAIFFNSLYQDLVEFEKDLTYLNFPIRKEEKRYYDHDALNRHTDNSLNCWYHYLRQLHEEKYGNFESGSRSSVPPYGDFFCGGHPSPGGNIVLADILEDKIKSL